MMEQSADSTQAFQNSQARRVNPALRAELARRVSGETDIRGQPGPLAAGAAAVCRAAAA